VLEVSVTVEADCAPLQEVDPGEHADLAEVNLYQADLLHVLAAL